MKARIFLILALFFSAFAVKAQDPAVAGINPNKSPLMVNETTIIEADILNGSSNPIPQSANATWTINLPPNVEVQSLEFDDPSANNFLSVFIGAYDPVDGTMIFIISDQGNFPGASVISGAYLALITVKGVLLTAPGIPAPMSINAATTPPVGTNNSGNDNANSTIVVQGVLPVTLVSFDAKKEGQATNLKWSTSAETNSDFFEIQHSVNGKDWARIGSLASNGESASLKNYTFSHSQPANGENLYRLKMVDKDLTFAYSSIKSVKFDGIEKDLSVYPNPVASKLYIREVSEVAKVQILSLDGKVILQAGAQDESGIDVSKLHSGIYIVDVTRKNGVKSSQKIVVNK